MSKILLLILAVAIVWWLAKGMRRKQPGSTKGETSSEQMVICSHCGLYLPKNEAVPQNEAGGQADKFFCSEEHRRLAG